MIGHLDHRVLTTAHETECVRFCTDVLGIQLDAFTGGTRPVLHRSGSVGDCYRPAQSGEGDDR